MNPSPKHPKTARIFTALLEALGLSVSELARELSTPGEVFSQQLIATYASGQSKANEKVLAAIVQRFPKVDARALLTGKGSILLAASTQSNDLAEPAAVVPSLDTIPAKKLTPVAEEADDSGTRQVDMTRRYIDRLEKELTASQGREVFWQERAERLEKPSPALDATWLPEPRTEIRKWGSAYQAAPECKVISITAYTQPEKAVAA